MRILFFVILPAVLTGFGVAVEENNQNLMMRLESTAGISSTVSLSNNTDSPVRVLHIVAAYADSGRMLNCVAAERSLGLAESANLTVSWDSAETNVRVKSFALDADTMAPLRDAWESDGRTSGGKTLIAWFSRANNIGFDPNVDAMTSASINLIDGNPVGNAKLLADMAQAAVGGDEFAIIVTMG